MDGPDFAVSKIRWASGFRYPASGSKENIQFRKPESGVPTPEAGKEVIASEARQSSLLRIFSRFPLPRWERIEVRGTIPFLP
jgi:hypothetical protein